MTARDNDQKLSEGHSGPYSAGGRIGPDPDRFPNRSTVAESKSWTQRAGEDTPPQSFSAAEATSYGQMVGGGSDQVGGGFGGANVGGYGQQGLGSQWGQGGYGPITQGANYSAGGSGFGPAGFQPYPEGPSSGAHRSGPVHRDPKAAYERPSPAPLFGPASDFGGSAHDHHEPHYRHWRDTKLAAHDQDYARWRDDQTRRYDEEYRTWRNTHHTEFSQAFEGWRDQRTSPVASRAEPAHPGLGDPNAAHGANPMLGDIADGGTGARRHRHEHEPKHEHESRAEADRYDAAPKDPAV